MSGIKLNIIIPLYNPYAGWEKHFVDALLVLKKELAETDLQIILVNDGSTNEIGNINELTERFRIFKVSFISGKQRERLRHTIWN